MSMTSNDARFLDCWNQTMSAEGDNATAATLSAVKCMEHSILVEVNERSQDLHDWLLILAGALVFFMQAGFAVLCAGCVRKKNVQNTMLKNLLDACGAAIAFYCVGYAFAFGGQEVVTETTFVGHNNFFLMGTGDNEVNSAFWFYEYAFAATATTIVAGTLAERCQMAAYFCYSIFLTGWVYPVVAHAIWSKNGFLSNANLDPGPSIGRGCIDFAGSGAVHLTGGMTAIVATRILGPRRGRFTDARGRPLSKARKFPGHSIALQLMGTMILWFGWYGFNPGSALLLTHASRPGRVAAVVAINTTLSAASGAISALFINCYMKERKTGDFSFDLTKAMNGALGGLVAITAPCGTVESWAAIIIGLVAGVIYLFGSKLLVRFRLDDAVDAIPVHMFNGAWGLLVTGFLSSPGRVMDAYGDDTHVGWFYSLARGSTDATLLANQVIALLFIMGWSTAMMWPFFVVLDLAGILRIDSLEEVIGLDVSFHDSMEFEEDDQDEEEVRDAYIQEYRERKGLRRRHMSSPETDEMSACSGSVASNWRESRTTRGVLRDLPEQPEQSEAPEDESETLHYGNDDPSHPASNQ